MTGFLALDKEAQLTSFFAAHLVGKILGEKKCGHTGTLDPNATGVLPIALGGATRFISLLPDHTKRYEATFRTGLRTDTLDIWGTVTEQSGKTASPDAVQAVLPQFRGRILQTPPMVSALKKDGVRLYDLARQGMEVEREARPCEVFLLEVAPLPSGDFSLVCECSAGTYIRSLVDDIGAALGCGATLTALRRTAACGVTIDRCVTLDGLRQAAADGSVSLLPTDALLTAYPAVTVTDGQARRFANGGALLRDRVDCGDAPGYRRVYAPDGRFLGLGDVGESELTVKRVFRNDE
jgi:tRNA pseudouridine55 synthase